MKVYECIDATNLSIRAGIGFASAEETVCASAVGGVAVNQHLANLRLRLNHMLRGVKLVLHKRKSKIFIITPIE